MTNEPDGLIVSFYSFKGGVGRSMAVANVAALLCKAGKSVLIVDWDLEAPGLHKFFERSSPGLREEVGSKLGVLDLICGEKDKSELHWQDCRIDVRLGDRGLHLISAGRRDTLYTARLQSLQWDALYEEHNIGQMFEDMREDWKRLYDYVLLDSRTGVTDIGDVCTALLPDLLVTVFVANEQNIDGTKLIIDRARAVHGQLPRDRAKLVVVPLLGRDESYSEYELSLEWRSRITRELGFMLSDWLPKEVDPHVYFQKVFIPYYSYWSFGENLPVIEREEEIGNPTSISAAYARFASLIENGLDWTAIEKGVDTAEINSLRSRASLGDTRSAELEASRIEVGMLEIRRREIEAQARSRVRLAWVVGVITIFACIVLGVAYLSWKERQYSEVALEKALVEQTKFATELDRAHAETQDAKRETEQQKGDFNRQLADLQAQNQDLLNKLNQTTRQLENQNSTTQHKLDEILRRNNQSFKNPF
ncbi:AAA family ATPase [Mesorhizobium sp. VK4C]|uniref:KGGVGR-motif variant AAA ATPase n=1 Tax=Mesorhizobium captivum TaxID=3072319 RepID=UPI002A247DBE|nr:P-loop NTPase [Mesorhizobium sp. VK4C]MDX8501912.1 AAA family ATPase [Mesorhizobium sp. VK4C]